MISELLCRINLDIHIDNLLGLIAELNGDRAAITDV